MGKLTRHFLLVELDATLKKAQRLGKGRTKRKITEIRMSVPVWRELQRERKMKGFNAEMQMHEGVPVTVITDYWHDFVIVAEDV